MASRRKTYISIETKSGGEQELRVLPVDLIASERAGKSNPSLAGGIEGAVHQAWLVLRRTDPTTSPDFDAWVSDELLDLWSDTPDEESEGKGATSSS